MKRNIEVKARCGDLGRAEEIVRNLGGRFEGVLRQTDTYFRAAEGRLKLREIEGVGAELIWYERENRTGDRASDYLVVPVADAAGTKQALGRAMGVRGEVRKVRRLLLWENVRVHLDEVQGLGTFLEFEAVVSEREGEAISYERLRALARELGVVEGDRVGVSYSDLLGL